jgi:YEATS domain-containing protein 1/3
MSIKLTFEIGHSASRKTKPSKEGFTHDWELFVRGVNEGNDIGNFVEKVVFNLHDSFPKPKRVFKEPPYVVKEAGYAGFLLTIDIYLKNRDEPKKVTFEYDLDLQPYKVQVNELLIATLSDEFKRKCLKGGGVLISSSSDQKNRESFGKNPQFPPVNDIKKLSKRPEEAKPNKQFTDLFGAPLKKPDSRSLQSSSPNPTKVPSVSMSKVNEKVPSSSGSKDKIEKSKHKHSPNKDVKDTKK